MTIERGVLLSRQVILLIIKLDERCILHILHVVLMYVRAYLFRPKVQ